MKKLILGARDSRLARTQTQWAARKIQYANPDVEIEIKLISTTGDRDLQQPLTRNNAKGLFTLEIDRGLLDGSIDLAVHSLKDLPVESIDGCEIVAVPERELPGDVLVSRSGSGFIDLPAGGRVGTSSLRRRAQLFYRRADLHYVDIRGNVDTRIQKLDDGEFDAVILAAAGLRRLGMAGRITESFTPDVMLPAPGQGALAIVGRSDRTEVRDLAAKITDRDTLRAVTAERSMLGALGGGCHVPISALATVTGECLMLEGLVISPDGMRRVRDQISGPVDHAQHLGRELADRLVQAGAGDILEQCG